MRRVFNRTWLGYLSAMCLGASAITLGRALEIFNGFFHPDALNWLTAALVLCLIGVIAHRFVRGLSNAGVVAVSALLTAGIAWQIEQMLVAKSPGMYIKDTVRMWPFYTGVILQGGLIAAGVAGVPAMRRIWFPAVLAVSLAIGVWMIKASPNPYIDVVTVHKEAIDAFLHHRDPYRISFENIYGTDSGLYYNPAAVIGKRLAIAYPYPPASLIFAVPGHFLFGDFRYSELAWLILGARPHRLLAQVAEREARRLPAVDDAARLVCHRAGLDRADRDLHARVDGVPADSQSDLGELGGRHPCRHQAVPRVHRTRAAAADLAAAFEVVLDPASAWGSPRRRLRCRWRSGIRTPSCETSSGCRRRNRSASTR